MPAKDPAKNLKFVRKSQKIKKQDSELKQLMSFTAMFNPKLESKYRKNLKKANGIIEYKKQQAE